MHSWQLQDAKAQFSKLIRRATGEGPQEISVRGEATAVVLSRADYLRLITPHLSLAAFLKASPLAGLEIDITRNSSPDRDVDL
jgi:antitoxin Phd